MKRFLFLFITVQIILVESQAQVLTAKQPVVEITKLAFDNLYRVSIYNNGDSVLCILTSVAGQYKLNSIDTVGVHSIWEKTSIYKIDHLVSDSRIDPNLPIRSKICILPYQQKAFDLLISEKATDMVLRITYFFTKKLDYPATLKEMNKPMWFRRYHLNTIDSPFPTL